MTREEKHGNDRGEEKNTGMTREDKSGNDRKREVGGE